MKTMMPRIRTRKRRTKAPRRRTRAFLSIGLTAMALFLLLAGGVRTAKAGGGPPPAPEIDAGTMGGALTLLVGGALMLTDRARRPA